MCKAGVNTLLVSSSFFIFCTKSFVLCASLSTFLFGASSFITFHDCRALSIKHLQDLRLPDTRNGHS
jgi:hypothetical protein